MKRAILILLILVFASSASAASRVRLIHTYPAVPHQTHDFQLVGATGKPLPIMQQWVDQARVPMTPAASVTIIRGECPRWNGLADSCAQMYAPYTIWMRTIRPPAEARFILSHELGHIHDLGQLTEDVRDRYKQIMHEPVAQDWWAEDPVSMGHNAIAERFAEAFAACALFTSIPRALIYPDGKGPAVWNGMIPGDDRSVVSYEYAPTQAQHAAVCRLIRSAG